MRRGRPKSDRLVAKRDPEALGDFDGGDQKTYAAIVTRMDQQVGRVLDALEKAGVAQGHDRGLHVGQWRRALLRHLALHGQEDRPA